jgi:hypothetical protein
MMTDKEFEAETVRAQAISSHIWQANYQLYCALGRYREVRRLKPGLRRAEQERSMWMALFEAMSRLDSAQELMTEGAK